MFLMVLKGNKLTVQELIDILNEVEDKTLNVVLWTDQGQRAMHLETTGESYVDDLDSYMMESIHEDDLDEYEEPIKVYELGAP